MDWVLNLLKFGSAEVGTSKFVLINNVNHLTIV